MDKKQGPKPLLFVGCPHSRGLASFARPQSAARFSAMKALWVSLLVLAGMVGLALLALQSRTSPSALEDYGRLWQARDGLPSTLRDLGALAQREDGVGWQARVLLGRYYAAQGSFEAAATQLKVALGLRSTSVLREELARALEGAGQFQEALREWEKLLPKAEAIEAVVRLYTDPVEIARTLTQGGAPSRALAVLQDAKGPQAALERGRALASLGRRQEAAQELQTYLAAFPQDQAVRLELGRVWERLGNRERALEAYRAAGPSGAHNAGLLLEALGRSQEAITAYLESAEPEARWRAARLLETQGKETQALSLYRNLSQGNHRVKDDAALRAYLILTRQGERGQATSFAKLLPPAFLWLLGYSEGLTPQGLLPDPAFVHAQAVEVANALIQAWPKDGPAWARTELDLALRKASAQEKIAIAEWHLAQGDFNAVFRIGAAALGQLPCRRAYTLAYPLAYEGSVRRWSQIYGVDPDLVWAVMREESAYAPSAVSSSDARGLMQLLPSTAKWIAQDMLGTSYREADLVKPDYNIQLGTWYLAYLLKQFDGDVARAVAAYNGGPGNLRRWTSGGPTSPADLPALLQAPETREYLVKVLNSWLIYRWLYTGAATG